MSRERPGTGGNFPGNPDEHSGGVPGRNGNRPFRGVPGFPPPRLTADPTSSESESMGPSYRGAVGGTLSRSISIRAEK
jgi:hypothetical protein